MAATGRDFSHATVHVATASATTQPTLKRTLQADNGPTETQQTDFSALKKARICDPLAAIEASWEMERHLELSNPAAHSFADTFAHPYRPHEVDFSGKLFSAYTGRSALQTMRHTQDTMQGTLLVHMVERSPQQQPFVPMHTSYSASMYGSPQLRQHHPVSKQFRSPGDGSTSTPDCASVRPSVSHDPAGFDGLSPSGLGKRVKSACNPCKASKTKCDNARPCARCIKVDRAAACCGSADFGTAYPVKMVDLSSACDRANTMPTYAPSRSAPVQPSDGSLQQPASRHFLRARRRKTTRARDEDEGDLSRSDEDDGNNDATDYAAEKDEDYVDDIAQQDLKLVPPPPHARMAASTAQQELRHTPRACLTAAASVQQDLRHLPHPRMAAATAQQDPCHLNFHTKDFQQHQQPLLRARSHLPLLMHAPAGAPAAARGSPYSAYELASTPLASPISSAAATLQLFPASTTLGHGSSSSGGSSGGLRSAQSSEPAGGGCPRAVPLSPRAQQWLSRALGVAQHRLDLWQSRLEREGVWGGDSRPPGDSIDRRVGEQVRRVRAVRLLRSIVSPHIIALARGESGPFDPRPEISRENQSARTVYSTLRPKVGVVSFTLSLPPLEPTGPTVHAMPSDSLSPSGPSGLFSLHEAHSAPTNPAPLPCAPHEPDALSAPTNQAPPVGPEVQQAPQSPAALFCAFPWVSETLSSVLGFASPGTMESFCSGAEGMAMLYPSGNLDDVVQGTIDATIRGQSDFACVGTILSATGAPNTVLQSVNLRYEQATGRLARITALLYPLDHALPHALPAGLK